MTDNANPTDQHGENAVTEQEQNQASEETQQQNAASSETQSTETTPVESASDAPEAAASGTTDDASSETESAQTAPPASGGSDSTPSAEAGGETAAASESSAAAGEGAASGDTPPDSTDKAGPIAGDEAHKAESGPSPTSVPDEAAAADTAGPIAAEPGESAEGEAPAEPEPSMSLEEMRQIWGELEAKKESRDPIDVTITGSNRGGVVTEYQGVEIFVPLSHWSIDRSSDTPDAQDGDTVPVYILEITHFDTDARRVTGTRRAILRKVLIESLEEGQRLQGRVSSITDFGAFIDIGGVDGLLHVSEMSYARNKQPNELVKKGDELEVVIKSIEKGGKRISLGHKELFDSPWVGAATKYPPDSLQKGKVVSLTDLGAFIELEPGIDGLIRPRELSWTQRVGSASDVLSRGQEIEVMVLNVNEDQERMSLSLKRAQENPWPQIVERFSTEGQTYQAEVRELSNKGAVVSVDGVEGFLPRGRMGRDARKLTELNPGDKLEVRVVEIDPKRPSVIFGTPMDGGGGHGGGGGGGRRGGRGDRDRQAPPATPVDEVKNSTTVGNFSLGDMLGDALREKLGIEKEEAAPAAQTKPATQDKAPATEAPAASSEAPSTPATPAESSETNVSTGSDDNDPSASSGPAIEPGSEKVAEEAAKGEGADTPSTDSSESSDDGASSAEEKPSEG